MAVINNTFTEIGDAAIVKVQAPVQGIAFFYTFKDLTDGVTDERFFKKEVRYSLDGFNYSIWRDIVNDTISVELEVPSGFVFIEFRYTRAGTDSSGVLTWLDVGINALSSRSFLKKINDLTSDFYPTGWAWRAPQIVIEDVAPPVEAPGLEDELESTIYG